MVKAHQLPKTIKYVPDKIDSNITNLKHLFNQAYDFNDDI